MRRRCRSSILARYCAPPEAAAGLCSLSSTRTRPARLDPVGTGTLSSQAGVTAADDYVTNLVQPIVPAAFCSGVRWTSEIGRDAGIRRHAYNARISLARQVLDYAVGIRCPRCR